MARFLLLSLLLASTSAFLVAPLVARRAAVARPVVMSIEQAAKDCLEEGCPIDLVEELMYHLEALDNTKVCTKHTTPCARPAASVVCACPRSKPARWVPDSTRKPARHARVPARRPSRFATSSSC